MHMSLLENVILHLLRIFNGIRMPKANKIRDVKLLQENQLNDTILIAIVN